MGLVAPGTITPMPFFVRLLVENDEGSCNNPRQRVADSGFDQYEWGGGGGGGKKAIKYDCKDYKNEDNFRAMSILTHCIAYMHGR